MFVSAFLASRLAGTWHTGNTETRDEYKLHVQSPEGKSEDARSVHGG